MTDVSDEDWTEAVRRYEDAMQASDKAYEVYAQLLPQQSGYDEVERRYEALRETAYDEEARLLSLRPPNLAAAAYQLKVFGLRYCEVDLDEAPSRKDEPATVVLRQIHDVIAEAVPASPA